MVQAEEGVMLYTGFPQVFTGPIAGHVEANQVFHWLILKNKIQQASAGSGYCV